MGAGLAYMSVRSSNRPALPLFVCYINPATDDATMKDLVLRLDRLLLGDAHLRNPAEPPSPASSLIVLSGDISDVVSNR